MHVQRRFVLVGPLAGRSFPVGPGGQYNQYSFAFKNGVLDFEGPDEDANNLGLYLKRCFNAHPEGPELEKAKKDFRELMVRYGKKPKDQDSEITPYAASTDDIEGNDGDAHSRSEGKDDGRGGSQSPLYTVNPEADPLVVEAILALDPVEDTYWNSKGEPYFEQIGSMIGRDVSKAEIKEAIPNYSRKIARMRVEAQEL